jgi:hypothetical protein
VIAPVAGLRRMPRQSKLAPGEGLPACSPLRFSVVSHHPVITYLKEVALWL